MSDKPGNYRDEIFIVQLISVTIPLIDGLFLKLFLASEILQIYSIPRENYLLVTSDSVKTTVSIKDVSKLRAVETLIHTSTEVPSLSVISVSLNSMLTAANLINLMKF